MSHGPLLHFTSDRNLESILREGRVRPSSKPFGVWPIPEVLRTRHLSACFSSLPFEEALKLSLNKGKWGIAFKRSALVRAGARPVVYLSREETAQQKRRQHEAHGLPEHPLWNDSPFLSPTLPTYDYEWESEWRKQSGFAFDWDDIEYLISPDGTRLKMVPDRNLGELWRDPGHYSGDPGLHWEDGDSEPFNRIMRQVVREIEEEFISPDDAAFLTDRDDETGYSWPVEKYDEWQILEELVPGIPDRILDVLVSDLQSRAWYWAKSSDLEDLVREANDPPLIFPR